MNDRGYFEIGIFHGKTPENVGTLWRSAYQMGAAGIFTIGRRYPKQASDTVQAYRHIPLRDYATFDDFLAAQPYDCPLIAVEMGGKPLSGFTHPERGIYLLGAEDHGLPPAVLLRCQRRVSLPSVRVNSYNVSVAGSLVMYDRMMKRQPAMAEVA
jgi:tRNA G18 (ribose-2'-O)-methylase SpoU